MAGQLQPTAGLARVRPTVGCVFRLRRWLIAAVVATLAGVGLASPAWACQTIAWPSATFRGSALRVDELSSTVTFQIDEVVSTQAMSNQFYPPTRPIEWPSAGTTIEVGYPPSEAGELRVGDRYEVRALNTVDVHVPWQSSALTSYASDFSVGPRCGAVEHPALTTLVGGASIESPARTALRSSLAALGRWWPLVATTAVLVVMVATFVVRRARPPTKTLPVPGST